MHATSSSVAQSPLNAHSAPAQRTAIMTAAATLVGALAAGLAFGLAGCKSVDDGPVDGGRPTVVNPSQPSDAVVDRLSITSSWPEDTDANGYPDQIGVTAFLFDSRQPVVSIRAPGTFTARLLGADGKDVRTWTLTEKETDDSLRRMPVGPGYVFILDLNANGGDKLPTQNVDLLVSFTTAEGKVIRSRGATSLRVGRGATNMAR